MYEVRPITQDELKEQVHYNPDTGIFIRRKDMHRPVNEDIILGYEQYGYVNICTNGSRYRAHRLAWLYMTGSFPKYQIDHINHIRNDNRFVNLRDVTALENSRNTSIRKKNRYDAIGIDFNIRKRIWKAYITVNKELIHLGLFKSKDEAIIARKIAENKYGFHPNHGESKCKY